MKSLLRNQSQHTCGFTISDERKSIICITKLKKKIEFKNINNFLSYEEMENTAGELWKTTY